MREVIVGGFLLVAHWAAGQVMDTVTMSGEVTYITSSNAYVRFESTEGIEPGDTLFFVQAGDPAAIVLKKSSISCVVRPMDGVSLEIHNELLHREIQIIDQDEPAREALPDVPTVLIDSTETLPPESEATDEEEERKKIRPLRGRIGVSSHSIFRDSWQDPNIRMRYTFSLRSDPQSDSKWTTDIYAAYRQNMGPNTESNVQRKEAPRIFSLSLGYNPTPTTSIVLGRRINRYISNVGAIDGLQLEKSFGDFRLGGVVGSRPGISDFGYTTALFQYGAYLVHDKTQGSLNSQSALGFFEQRNHGNIDRRFAYFQHSSTPIKHLNMFFSFDVDLFEKVNEVEKSTVRLSSLYISARYRFSRKLSLFVAYDNRRNVIFFETYKHLVDQLIENASRQGMRLRLNWRPWKYINMGLMGGYRFQKDDPNSSRTAYAYITHTRVPWINTSVTVSMNYIKTLTLDGRIYGVRLNKDLVRGKLFGTGYFRLVDYVFPTYEMSQSIVGVNLNWRIMKPLMLSVNYEETIDDNNPMSRFHINLIYRF
jgi:hypothetical protein